MWFFLLHKLIPAPYCQLFSKIISTFVINYLFISIKKIELFIRVNEQRWEWIKYAPDERVFKKQKRDVGIQSPCLKRQYIRHNHVLWHISFWKKVKHEINNGIDVRIRVYYYWVVESMPTNLLKSLWLGHIVHHLSMELENGDVAVEKVVRYLILHFADPSFFSPKESWIKQPPEGKAKGPTIQWPQRLACRVATDTN